MNQLEIDIGLQAVSFTRPSTYYFAEGSTRPGFEPYLCIANPGEAEAVVAIDYMLGDGTTREQYLAVPPASRATVPVASVLGSAGDTAHDFSAVVTCTNGQVIVAERPMYFDYRPGILDTTGGPPSWTGGHCVVGAPSPANAWYFAEGNTRFGFDEWLTIQNPNDVPITVDAEYRFAPGQGDPVTRTYSVEPGRRHTVFVADEVGVGKDVSVQLASTASFLAERPMYFDYGGMWDGGHDVVGLGR